jgi:hypothetical protein
MNIKKIVLAVIFLFSIVFLAVGIGMFFIPLNHITINGVRQIATPENTRIFRLVFLFVFGGIGVVSAIAGVLVAVIWKPNQHTGM